MLQGLKRHGRGSMVMGGRGCQTRDVSRRSDTWPGPCSSEATRTVRNASSDARAKKDALHFFTT